MSITVFLVSLFVVPLYRIIQTDLGTLNDRQRAGRMRLRRLLEWSVALTFLHLFSSNAMVLVHLLYKNEFSKLFDPFDQAINVWTSMLMMRRNRGYLKQVCCHCKWAQGSGSLSSSQRSNSMLSSVRSLASFVKAPYRKKEDEAPEIV